jgi:hypothetical protein
MDYAEARKLIMNGDIIATKRVHGLFEFLTKFFTGQYTLTGITVWIERGFSSEDVDQWFIEANSV